jgi:hypothetical protein
VLLNGEKNAMPRPPSVRASKMGWEIAQRKRNGNAARVRAMRVPSVAVMSAKAIEWVKPRWPNVEPYGMP